ncbi:MAG: hypothetical protein K9G36_06230 [Crocinitomicaceae bacterium]|nr:hypothetical protein [Crocinitomicaceae bacterium]MCF8411014.1 hypothetical protein [Crocinitomicaceae bacterium]MCF8444000.1 hypothetical protein [Crocinitomicaceae bacterium]
MKINFFVVFFILGGVVFGQNIKSEDLKYNYVKLPTTPIQPRVANYQSSLSSASDEENAKILAQYEKDKAQADADYDREMAEYPVKVKAADEKYEKAMAEYNDKSLAKKILEKQLLNENTKPVKDYVPQPYKRNVSKPDIKTVYDYPSLASTYLKLDGFSKGTDNALSYHVNMQGFEHSQPAVKTEIKKEAKVVNGTSTTADVTYYWVEFTYRNQMSVRVANAANQDIYFVAPTELAEFKTYKTTSSKTAPSSDYAALFRTVEEKVLKENLTFINHLVNDRIGYEITERETSLDYVKSKKDEYQDVTDAYNDQLLGLKSLITNETVAKEKLNKAAAQWLTILKESDVANKKARIDKDVTISIYFNLLECYFPLRNNADAEMILSTLERMDISNRERKLKEKYAALFLDLSGRKVANGL